jgi:hypothetical protein
MVQGTFQLIFKTLHTFVICIYDLYDTRNDCMIYDGMDFFFFSFEFIQPMPLTFSIVITIHELYLPT